MINWVVAPDGVDSVAIVSAVDAELVDHDALGVIMIRSELVQLLARDNPDLTSREVDRIVELFFDEISGQLAKGGRVELRGFGTFSTRARDGRTGRNPRTGGDVEIDSKRVPYFKPGKDMRKRLNMA